MNKTAIRNFLGEFPLAAELDWRIRQKNRVRKDHYSLERLRRSLAEACKITVPFVQAASRGSNILFFATLHYWIEQSAYIALVLAGLGHKVTLMTLPYAEWHKDMDKFMRRQRILLTRDTLNLISRVVNHVSMLELPSDAILPEPIKETVKQISMWDTQYTLMREEIDLNVREDRALYDLRLNRNSLAARVTLDWMKTHQPDVVVVPNGLILEMGIVCQVGRHLGIPVVTFEFNDQREQIWLAQNSSIMQQDTDYLVEARGHLPVSESMVERVADLENARRGARVWGKSKRLWQYVSAQGADVTRQMVGLDSRPVVMLAANVLGDSLTLGRDIFAKSMTEWITRTVRFLAEKPEIQAVIRVHPGEMLVPRAKSMAQVVLEALPKSPDNIHIIGSTDKINTYDLIEIADLGLAYTTTVGLETAMNGRPVIVCGQTHYRGRGFTLDPVSWEDYFSILGGALADLPSHRLRDDQIESAWNYAYRFFFEYPRPFPWRLMNFCDDLEVWPLQKVLSLEGLTKFGETFDFLVGKPFTWKD